MLPRAVRGGQGLAFNVLTRAMSRAAAQDMQVVHDEENMEFYIKLGQDKAYLQYDILDPKTKAVDLQHTVVPEVFRGQGIAKVLAKEVFEYFISKDQQMKLTCWYLQKYYKDNPLPHYTEKIIQS
ncbi:protein NATD1-like [Portunus trituberculatus]|uniref:protein NATD1-like n=1 Tax=Portunus trituberculatus TaxID=210409 RepID=UPI001E1CEAA1|nr:protein NATD1-like [Portunus trituberculatus]